MKANSARGVLAAVLTGLAGVIIVAGKPWVPTTGEAVIPAAGTIRVVPDPAMALTDWNSLLHVLQLRVVGGPDSVGAYTVAPMGGTALTQQTLRQLRAIRGIRLADR